MSQFSPKKGLRIMLICMFLGLIQWNAFSQTIKTVGGVSADYATLTAAFNAVNNGVLTGDIDLQIINNTTEIASATLTGSGTGSANYTSVHIYPVGAGGYTILGPASAYAINLNGADNVFLDGRLNGTGQHKSLTIASNYGSILLQNSAENNVFQHCILKGQIYFYQSAAGNGNDNNLIDQNDITSLSVRTVNAIYSRAQTGPNNSNNTVSNNNIYNVFSLTATYSSAIYIHLGNSNWNISGNSIYETTELSPTSNCEYDVILIYDVGAGNGGFVISNNYIGGTEPQCAGSALVKTNSKNNVFIGISTGSIPGTPATIISGNVIQNINWHNSGAAAWTGIYDHSGANIGTTAGNTIGAATGTGSITVTADASGAEFKGISTGLAVNCENNQIGSISVGTTDPDHSFSLYGIFGSYGSFRYNIVGSATTANSIIATSPSLANAQIVKGICSSHITSNIVLNTVKNLTNNTSNANTATLGTVIGICTYGTADNNVVGTLKINNLNTASDNNASIIGIAKTGTAPNSVSGNTVYNLSNENSSFQGSVIGIYCGGGSGASFVGSNFIHSLNVNSGSSDATLIGLRGLYSIRFYNNIITLSCNSATTIYGLYVPQDSYGESAYFNTIYLNGIGTAGSNNSYCLYSVNNTSSRDIRNNLLSNNRTNSGGTGKHYSTYIQSGGTLTMDYNNYYTPGTGGMLGNYNGVDINNLATWQSTTSNDAHSLVVNPNFVAPGGLVASDYKVTTAINGITISTVTLDYSNNSRGATPTLGAWEFNLNKWTGQNDNDFGNINNWSDARVPIDGESIIFDASAQNNMNYSGSRNIHDITNPGTRSMVLLAGAVINITGQLNFSSTGKIDATNNTSQVCFSGTSEQIIPENVFESELINHLQNNNLYGLTINTDLTCSYFTGAANGLVNVNADNTLDIENGSSTSNAIDNSHTFVLKSNNSATASLLLKEDDNSVNATVERYVLASDWNNGEDGWHFVSSPVASQTINTVSKFVTTGVDNDYDFYAWYEPTNQWINFKNTTTAPTWNDVNGNNNFKVGTGYMAAYQQTDTKLFNGVLNNTDVSVTNLTHTGSTNEHRSWNLVGNPFCAAIEWYNGWTLTNIGGVANIWNEIAQSYTPVNQGEVIPNGNGFMVSVNNNSGGSLVIPRSARITNNPNWYKAGTYPVIKLFATNLEDQSYQETQIRFNPLATSGFDDEFDGDFIQGFAPQFYSTSVSDKLMVNSLPLLTDETSIPLNFIKNVGNLFSIKAEVEESLNSTMWIFDKVTSVDHNLSVNPEFSFVASETEMHDRFLLHFGSVGITEIPSPISEVHYGNNLLTFNLESAKSSKLEVYDLAGRLLIAENTLQDGNNSIAINLTPNCYIVKLTSENKISCSKIVLL